MGVSVLVSIHAPVKGATTYRFLWSRGASFNPRAREGRDRRDFDAALFPKFQSTRP